MASSKSSRRVKLMLGNRILTLAKMLSAGHYEMATDYYNVSLYWLIDVRKLGDIPTAAIDSAVRIGDDGGLRIIAEDMLELAIQP